MFNLSALGDAYCILMRCKMHYENIVIVDLYGQLFPAGLSTQIYARWNVFFSLFNNRNIKF